MANKCIQTDVVIVGAGLVGLTAAISLFNLGFQVTLVDRQVLTKRMTKAWDARIYALTESNRQWLSALGVWQHVNPKRVNPISAMHLWQGDGGKAPDLVLDADVANLNQMGCIIESQNLMVAAWKALKNSDVRIVTDVTCDSLDQQVDAVHLTLSDGQQIAAKLLLGVDGAQSWIRQSCQIGVQSKDFHQAAIVANFATAQAHHDVAKQWFGVHETLALLPMPNDTVSLVWALPTERADKTLNSTELDLTDLVVQRAQLPENSLSILNAVHQFPLKQQVAESLVLPRVALLGDAAHQVHPMAGQGVNLGFKGVIALEKSLCGLQSLQDIGDYHVLRAYERSIKQDMRQLTSLTSGLDAVFGLDYPILKQGLALGMQQLNQTTWLKKQMIRHATV